MKTKLKDRYRRWRECLRLYAQWRSIISCAKRLNHVKDDCLIIPPDPWSVVGSRGDQAMIMVAVENLSKHFPNSKIDILTYSKSTDEAVRSINGLSPLQEWDVDLSEFFKKHLSEYSHVVILGADCIDGHYYPEFSVKILMMYDVFYRYGVDVRMFGASWSENHWKGIKFFIRKLSPELPLVIRDVVSYRRVKNLFPCRPAVLVADSAFCLKAHLTDRIVPLIDVIKKNKDDGWCVVGINAHNMFNSVVDLEVWIRKFGEILNSVSKEMKLCYVLLGHDDRDKVSDMIVLSKLTTVLSRCIPTCVVFNADEIKAIVGELDALVSGRMHLSIAALGQGVPVLGLTYQGKFEGLWQHFSLPNSLCFQPEKVVLQPKDFENTIKRFIMDLSEHKKTISSRLEDVIRLSEMNYKR